MGPFILHLSNDLATETQMYKSNESIVIRVEVKAECFRKNNKTGNHAAHGNSCAFSILIH